MRASTIPKAKRKPHPLVASNFALRALILHWCRTARASHPQACAAPFLSRAWQKPEPSRRSCDLRSKALGEP
eukprot:15091799-Alexandrium_andersonii.AAC.1